MTISSASDPADLARLVGATTEKMLAGIAGDDKQRAAATAAHPALRDVKVSDDYVATIDLPSGLTRRATYRKVVAILGQPARIETREYTRLD